MKAWVKIYHKTLIKTKLVYCLCLIFSPFCLRMLIKKINIETNKKVETYRMLEQNEQAMGDPPLLSTCISVISNFKIIILFL